MRPSEEFVAAAPSVPEAADHQLSTEPLVFETEEAGPEPEPDPEA